jgi:hypothetical protein
MSYLAAAAYADMTAHPENVAAYYDSLSTDFKSQFGGSFTTQPEDHFRLAFCCLMAFEMKPYGDEGNDLSLSALLASETLACNGYVALAWQLFKLNWPNSTTVIEAMGWNGGAVGNHVQMLAYTGNSVGMMFDPTYGIFCSYCSPQGLIDHYNFSASMVKSWFNWDSEARAALAAQGVGADISAEHDNVVDALQTGKYQFANYLYLFCGFDRWATSGASGDWPTPQAQIMFPPEAS